jgi:hypothetical protein
MKKDTYCFGFFNAVEAEEVGAALLDAVDQVVDALCPPKFTPLILPKR